MEDSEAKCDKCEVEVRPEPTGETVIEKILFRPEQLVALAALGDENRALMKQNSELTATLFGIGVIALSTAIQHLVFY